MITLKQPRYWTAESEKPYIWFFLIGLSYIYQAITWILQNIKNPVTLTAPSICVGNAIAGGAGKTPTLIALAKLLGTDNVVFLTRGYGGSIKQPTDVSQIHTYKEVGDEALLLFQTAPVIIARDRVLGAAVATDFYPDRIILIDDGLQNRHFRAWVNILVWDDFGIGNGHVIPAGPLREPLARLLPKCDAIVNLNTKTPLKNALPSFLATARIPEKLTDITVRAFAGIGRPEKFKKSLMDNGCVIEEFKSFPDHHIYSVDDVKSILDTKTPVLTTEKDWVRLPKSAKEKVVAVPYNLHFDDKNSIKAFLDQRLEVS